jgi:hypothetical protein
VALYSSVFKNLATGPDAALAARFARSHSAKTILSRVFYFAFCLYLPVGIAVNCAFIRLPMADCVGDLNLGQAYCAERVHPTNANWTVLWDYSPCVGTNTMRSVSQFFSICALLLFNASFVLDFGGSVVGERELTAIPRRETA